MATLRNGRATSGIAAYTGNLILLTLDSQVVATIRSASFQEDYGLEPVSGVGDIHVLEYVPSLARYTINVEYAVFVGKNLRKLGLMDEDGSVKLKGVEFDIEIRGKKPAGEAAEPAALIGTGGSAKQEDQEETDAIRKYTKCSYASGSISIQAHQIVMVNATFMARGVTGKVF